MHGSGPGSTLGLRTGAEISVLGLSDLCVASQFDFWDAALFCWEGEHGKARSDGRDVDQAPTGAAAADRQRGAAGRNDPERVFESLRRSCDGGRGQACEVIKRDPLVLVRGSLAKIKANGN